MNIVKLMGGVGNQLFQYAFGQAQMANGIEVKYDRTWFDNRNHNNTFREYRLDKFNTTVPISDFLKQQSIHETNFDLTLLIVMNCNFFGYWQYPEYYSNIINQIRKEICVNNIHYTEEYLRLKKQIDDTESISVHVRRGDYITTPGFYSLPLNYYFTALTKVKGDLFIFSDDISWCKEHFKEDYFSRQITFVELVDYLAFDLMRQCKNNIVGNSSFSLFAADLNDYPDKVVIIPKQWQKPHPSRIETEKDKYLPSDWISI